MCLVAQGSFFNPAAFHRFEQQAAVAVAQSFAFKTLRSFSGLNDKPQSSNYRTLRYKSPLLTPKSGYEPETNRNDPYISFVLLQMLRFVLKIIIITVYSTSCIDVARFFVRFVPLCIPNLPLVSITCKK